jgi:small subunit ribosomal protein S16
VAVKIRLKRGGTKNKPHWRIVVADSRSPRDGRFIENIGYYDPKTNPATVQFQENKLKQWIEKGAKPSETVRSLMKQKGL